jgi:hypothetical protein
VVLSSFGGGYGNQIDSKIQNRIEEILQKQTVTDDTVTNYNQLRSVLSTKNRRMNCGF